MITGAGGFIGGALYKKLKRYAPVGVALHLKGGDTDKNFMK